MVNCRGLILMFFGSGAVDRVTDAFVMPSRVSGVWASPGDPQRSLPPSLQLRRTSRSLGMTGGSRRSLAFAVVMAAWLPALAWAAEPSGKLPRGAPPPEAPITIEDLADDLKNIPKSVDVPFCQDYGASPFWDPVAYYAEEFYYLARVANNEKNSRFNYNMYRIHQDEKKQDVVQKLFSVVGTETMVLLSHGSPARGFSVVSLHTPSVGCGLGFGSGVSIPLLPAATSENEKQRRKPRQTIKNNRYKVVDATFGRQLFEVENNQLKEIDVESFQQRIMLRLKAGELPLYHDVGRKRLFVYYADERGKVALIKYVSLTKRNEDEIALRKGMRILQQDGKFGILETDTKTNTLKVLEKAVWSGAIVKDAEFPVPLPAKFPVGEAGLNLHFDANLAVIFGNSLTARTTWKEVYVYDYSIPLLLTQLNLARDEVLEAVTIDPAGKFIYFATVGVDSRLHRALRKFDVVTKKWAEIRLPL